MKNLTRLLLVLAFVSCKKDDDVVQYDPTPYTLEYGNFPAPKLPADNPLTVAGVELGRMLFYEQMLSKDGTQSCATCHKAEDNFNDIRRFSIGVDGGEGRRNAMSVSNLAWHNTGFFWDGRAATLREQALKPIQDPVEMNETLVNVVTKLKSSKMYQDQFTKAFKDPEINSDKVALALEQFMFTMVSHDSKYDKWLKGTAQLTDSEERGRVLFFTEKDPFNNIKGAECFHCHNGFDFSNHSITNNGLDADADFKDLGRFEVTKNASDKAKFKTPSLRNIELTPPYMHDGRFVTFEEVIEHYNSEIKQSSTLDPLLYTIQAGLELTPQDKADLIAFLKTLTDQNFTTNPKFQTPF